MSLSDPRTIFGVHSVTPYSRTNGLFYGTIRVLGGSALSLAGELVKLNGGSFKFPWAVEEGAISAELSLKVKEYPDFLFELFLGKAPTAVGADTSGVVGTLTNKFGTSVMNGTTGIASVAAIPTTGAANLKFTKYVVKATSSTAVSIYAGSSIDFVRGTDEDFDSDLLLVATGTITSASNTDIASLGIRFAGGSGTIGLTTGDTATFTVQPPSSSSMSVTIGGVADIFPEFGALCYAKKKGNLEMFEIDLFRVKAAGLPIGMNEGAWSEADIKAECFYDSAQNGIFSIRTTLPTS